MLIHREHGSKYGAVRCGGFPSKLEKAVYEMLAYRVRGGQISNLRRQVSVKLGLRWWKCDFCYEEKGETVFCEAKGYRNKDWMAIRSMWQQVGPGRLIVIGGRWQRPETMEILQGGAYGSSSTK